MVLFPNAKINIGLNIVAKRIDGYHDIETIFYPLNLHDGLEIIVDHAIEDLILSSSGIPVDCDKEKNLCYKAWLELSKHFSLPGVNIHLHKYIPFGAGLGGGSADAAFVLLGLRKLLKLDISDASLAELAANIGSDCPFFIYNQPRLALGKGDLLKPIPVDLENYYLLLVKPGFSIGTAEAYSGIHPERPTFSLAGLGELPIEEWKKLVKNDFEIQLFRKYPVLSAIKHKLYEKGAVYASMTGSGSALYGIFENDPTISGFEDCFAWKEKMDSKCRV